MEARSISCGNKKVLIIAHLAFRVSFGVNIRLNDAGLLRGWRRCSLGGLSLHRSLWTKNPVASWTKNPVASHQVQGPGGPPEEGRGS